MRRLLVLYGVAMTAVAIVAFLVPLGMLARGTAQDRALELGRQEAQNIGVVAAVADAERTALVLQATAGQSLRRTSVFLPDGRVLGEPAARTPEVDLAAAGRAFTADAPSGLQVFVPVGSADGVVVVRTFVPDELLRQGLDTTLVTLGVVGALFMATAVLAAFRIAGRISRSVHSLAAVAGRLAEGELTARADTGGPVEVRYVGEVLNGLGRRIDEMLTSEREFAADLSHRLRTPLTALRLDVEGVTDADERARLASHLAGLERSVDDLVRQAHIGRPVTSRRCDAAAVIRERLRFWAVPAQSQGRQTQHRITAEPCPVALGSDELGAALDVLIDNVFTHTPQGTSFSVAVDRIGPRVHITVSDRGPGLVGRDVVRRGTSSAGSTGLGLDIARSTADSAGGRLTVSGSPEGTEAVLDLPADLTLS